MAKTGISIIGGTFRGRKLQVADSPSLRPTTSLVRETVFNWLCPYIQNILTLDLFAGSGLLSFEALSRGAKHVVLLEKNRKIFQTLKKNAACFDSHRVTLRQCDAITYIKHHDLTAFGLLFIDPPFHTNLLTKALECLSGQLKPGTLLYLESLTPPHIDSNNIKIVKQKVTGQVSYTLCTAE